ncbi:MAG: cytochrome c3 family protein [Deltaproteobacteria bacterium]|nr:cytochrome c3 family protein [Candidatus Zymogenaceae bacterium]
MAPSRTKKSGVTTLTIGIVIAAAIAFGWALTLAQGDAGSGSALITLDEYDRGTGPVTFIHEEHGATGTSPPSCRMCHHTSNLGETPPACGECHVSHPNDDTPSTLAAFHLSCVGCHVREIKEGNSSVEITCTSCHRSD